MNNIINENKKNLELIKNDILSLINKWFDEINFNDKKELKLDDGSKYIGQARNGVPEGKGIRYVYNGNIYKGDFKNGKMEGKGIYYWTNGDRYEGEFINNKKEGKGIEFEYYNDGASNKNFFSPTPRIFPVFFIYFSTEWKEKYKKFLKIKKIKLIIKIVLNKDKYNIYTWTINIKAIILKNFKYKYSYILSVKDSYNLNQTLRWGLLSLLYSMYIRVTLHLEFHTNNCIIYFLTSNDFPNG